MESFLIGRNEKIIVFTGSATGTQTSVRCTLDLVEENSRDWLIPGFSALEMLEITVSIDKIAALTSSHHIEWIHPTDNNTKWLYTGLAKYDYAGPYRSVSLLFANTYVKSTKGFLRQYFEVRRKAAASFGGPKPNKTTIDNFYGRLDVLSQFRDRTVGLGEGLVYQKPMVLVCVWNTSNSDISIDKGDTIRVVGQTKEYEVLSVNSYMFKKELILKET